jgi:nucleotide-binding universal stress UspA family protein
MNCFERILIPVDFSLNTEVAVKKAINLATPGSSVLYLLHVSQSNLLRDNAADTLPSPTAEFKALQEIKLQQWQSAIEETEPGLTVLTHITNNSKVEESIIAFSREVSPSLIIIGKNNHHSFFPFLNTVISPHIAEQTNCPVLTVKPGSIKKGLRTIVMPVSDFFPHRKIDVLSMLSARMLLNVHLITVLNNNQSPDSLTASALLQSMKAIRNRFHCNVQHAIIHSNNKAIATLRYAENINADMLLVNPETEATITTWISKKDITDVLKPASQLQVLSVQPLLK